jgi:hypothetical protein
MSDADRIYLVTADSRVVKDVSGPVHAALLAQAGLSAKGTRFEVADDETGSVTTVDLSKCNPWKVLAAIREIMLDEDLGGGDTVESIGTTLDAAGLHADPTTH